MKAKKHHTDIVTHGWIERMPKSVRPYLYLMRLDRPVGFWLLVLPAWWSILLAGGGVKLLFLFMVGAIIMRGAGCVINDLWDRDLDRKVTRTKGRPLASGAVNSRQALVFLVFLLSLGLVVLLQFNVLTIMLGFLSVILVIIYPFMKRVTWWPQAFLGLTFNFGALMGWASVTGELSWQAWMLYAAGFFWTLGYDTIYALQDLEDDALVGVKSTARLFIDRLGVQARTPVYLFYGVQFFLLSIVVMVIALADIFNNILVIGTIICGLAVIFAHLMWQVKTLSLTDPKNALTRFKSNRDLGLLVCCTIFLLQLI